MFARDALINGTSWSETKLIYTIVTPPTRAGQVKTFIFVYIIYGDVKILKTDNCHMSEVTKCWNEQNALVLMRLNIC